MMGNRYYWMKLPCDFFNSKRIKALRMLDGGDSLLTIYLKMQLLTLKTDGVITYTGLLPSIEEELALDLDEDADKVRQTLDFLIKVNLLEVDGNRYLMPYVKEMTGSETASAERKRNQRKREKCDNVTTMSQKCHGEIEIEKEIEIEIDNISLSQQQEELIELFRGGKNVS